MSDRLKYLLNGVYKCENFAQCVINDNFEYLYVGESWWNNWYMELSPQIVNDRLVINPWLSCDIGDIGTEVQSQIRAYFNFLKKDGSSGFKIALNNLYWPSDNGIVEAYMDVEELLDEKNGFLDNGSLTIEYGYQIESQKFYDDGIWRFNLVDVFFDWNNQDNMFIFLIDYGTDKRPVFAHRQIVKLHSKKIFDFNENWVRGPNDNSLDYYDVIDCLQIVHGVREKLSHWDISKIRLEKVSKIARIASHYGFFNTIRYCEQQLIEIDEHPKLNTTNFELAVDCNMRRYLIHLLIHINTKQLAKLLHQSMKACVAKLFN